MVGGVGPGNRPHGLSFTGTEATLIVDGDGWEVIPEPRKKKLRTFKRPVDPNDRGADGRPAHVRNFLDCTRSRQQPVTNLEVGHFVSTVAHLGNIALQSGSKIKWQPGEERVEGLPETNMFITRAYRKPWALPGGKS
jgi:hypothetical protein